MKFSKIFDAHKRTCGFRSCGLVATVLGLLSSVALVGCATAPVKPKPSVDSRGQIRRLQTQLRKQKEVIQDLKERNLVLEKRETLNAGSRPEVDDADKATQLPGSFDSKERSKELADASAYSGGESIGGPVKAPSLPAELPKKLPQALQQTPPQTPISVSPAKTGEHFLYSKILETYRSRNEDEMQKTLQLLLKTYPESVFADNALYLSGLMAFESGNLTLAQKQFEKLLKDYPRSNKAVSALFAKASIEKRMGRTANAKRGFVRVRDLYPGSPESQRVSTELKLLDAAKSKTREM